MLEPATPNIGLDLQRIHRVISRGLAVALEYSQRFATSGFPDETTGEGFWKYCQGLEANTHGHHLTEDDLTFPFLQARRPELVLDGLRADHKRMAGILEEIKGARERGSLPEAHGVLARLAALWRSHIAVEEDAFNPEIMARVMTVPEQVDMAQRAAAHSAMHAEPASLSVPFLLYNVERDDRAHLLAIMPTELTQHLVPVVWKEEWAAMLPFLLP